MRRLLLKVFIIVILLTGIIPYMVAQTDTDGDGLIDIHDLCPNVPGPISNNGCPLPAPTSPPPPPRPPVQEPVPVEPVFVPTEVPPTSTPEPTQVPLPILPVSGDCRVATRTYERVNIRMMPSTESPIIGVLDPFRVYPVVAYEPQVDWWHVGVGWVSDTVIRSGGDCADLPGIEEADASNCPQLAIYSPEELQRLEDAGMSRADICAAAHSAPDRVCDEVVSNLTPEQVERYRAAGIALPRLCLPEDRVDAPCPLLGTLTQDQLARYEAAGVQPCGDAPACPAVARLTDAERARIAAAGLDVNSLCLEPLPPDAFCENLATTETQRLAGVGVNPQDICTPASTINIPGLINISVPLASEPPAENAPQQTIFSAPAQCSPFGTIVRLADSPYTGTAAITVNGDSYIGTSCNEVIFGNERNNILIGGGGNDWIFGFGGNDLISGGNGFDVVYGMNGDDTLLGSNDADILYGNAGTDRMTGGAGHDVMFQDSTIGTFSRTMYASLPQYPSWRNPVWNQLDSPGVVGITQDWLSSFTFGHQPTIQQAQAFDQPLSSLESLTKFHVMRGGAGNDLLYGSSIAGQMYGGSGADYLYNPVISTLCQSLGCNSLYGEDGNDFLEGAGNLVVLGDFGIDILLPIFFTPVQPGTTYFASPLDLCFTIQGVPVSTFTNTNCGCTLGAASLGNALGKYSTWLTQLVCK